jgi:hypothetical protein
MGSLGLTCDQVKINFPVGCTNIHRNYEQMNWALVMAFFWKIESFIFRFQLLFSCSCLTNPIIKKRFFIGPQTYSTNLNFDHSWPAIPRDAHRANTGGQGEIGTPALLDVTIFQKLIQTLPQGQ